MAQLNKLKVSYATQLADVQRLADDEAKVSYFITGFKLFVLLITLAICFIITLILFKRSKLAEDQIFQKLLFQWAFKDKETLLNIIRIRRPR